MIKGFWLATENMYVNMFVNISAVNLWKPSLLQIYENLPENEQSDEWQISVDDVSATSLKLKLK